MNSFTDLDAWKIGMELVKEVYRLTDSFPSAERFGLTSQLRRASTSILANLAEGFGRAGKADKAYKYTIARGECSETHALLLVSVGLNRLSEETAKYGIELVLREGRVFSGLIRAYTHSKKSSEPQPESESDA